MKEYSKIKIYIVAVGLLMSLYIYAGVTGWKFFSSNTEKWQPTEDRKYHK
jgi:hypothetical protein